MKKITRFVIWICSKFNKEELIDIILSLLEVILDKNPNLKPRDDFKDKHPNYRNFIVDSQSPIIAKPKEALNYKEILIKYQNINGKPLKPVNLRNSSDAIPKFFACPCCKAPSIYIYRNNGKRKSQFKCKVCSNTFKTSGLRQSKTKYFCPYCNLALFKWKEKQKLTKYKCGNKKCHYRKKRLIILNQNEKLLAIDKPSNFTLNYIFNEYHFDIEKLSIASPDKPKVDLTKIHNNINTVALSLTFSISYALSARATANILNNVFKIDISYQTVQNYIEAAAFYCHCFNLKFKPEIDDIIAVDETYIKINGVTHFTWLAISANNRTIPAYNITDNRDTISAISALREALTTKNENQNITFVADGNPAYQAALHFINLNNEQLNITLKKVIGLQNLDEESQNYRKFKQIIERLNRTYKHLVRASLGFAKFNGAVAKTVLFVTNYNFLREHYALGYKTPIVLPELKPILTIQGKWAKILSLAA
jgi:putative transposase